MKKIKKRQVLEFKVSLLGTEPLVWRKFLAHDFIKLSELHMLIQMTMGWEARHLYEFKINGISFMEKDDEIGGNAVDPESAILSDVIGIVKKFTYIYDFGDGWQHEVEIINRCDHDPKLKYPICIAGENACPPEDCGGIYGFDQLKKTLKTKNSKAKDEALEWLGGYYNPNSFDPNFVNKHLLWADF